MRALSSPRLCQPYYEARNDYTNNPETIILCHRCVCNGKINSQTINVCNWCPHRKVPSASAQLHKRIPARTPCVTDVLCNWEINSQIIKMCVCNHLGPIVSMKSGRPPPNTPRHASQNADFLGDHQPYTATTNDFGSKKVFQRGWCTNCQNLREQQNVYHPRIARAMS